MEYRCLNVLIIKGSEEDIQQLANKLLKPITRRMEKSGELLDLVLNFDRIVPTPKNFEGTLDPSSTMPGLLQPIDRWRIQNWGTREQPKTCCVKLKHHSIVACFETVWSPPEGVYRKIKAQYPDVELEYHFYNI